MLPLAPKNILPPPMPAFVAAVPLPTVSAPVVAEDAAVVPGMFVTTAAAPSVVTAVRPVVVLLLTVFRASAMVPVNCVATMLLFVSVSEPSSVASVPDSGSVTVPVPSAPAAGASVVVPDVALRKPTLPTALPAVPRRRLVVEEMVCPVENVFAAPT